MRPPLATYIADQLRLYIREQLINPLDIDHELITRIIEKYETTYCVSVVIHI